MRKYIYIGIGGGLGALLRWLLKMHPLVGFRGAFPINILLINISGSLLLAFLITAAFTTRKPCKDMKLGITTGFLGAFTTFSTYCKEIYALAAAGEYYNAALYSIITILLGLAAAFAGAALAGDILPEVFSWLKPRITNPDMPEDDETE